jgi:23S rRNA pseudouridine1911/1915/1917 synthase
MAKTTDIRLGSGERLPILYEDRAVLAVDKPRGWMLVPFTWQRTDRNLHAALVSAIAAGPFWARSRGIKYLRHVHRLDTDTTGILLLARSPGALDTFSSLFESRRMEKTYLAVVEGVPKQPEWTCRLSLAPVPGEPGRMRPDPSGKEAETQFRAVQTLPGAKPRTLIEAKPYTGRTHQIRVHLSHLGHPVAGDTLYGAAAAPEGRPWLHAWRISFASPSTGTLISLEAPLPPELEAWKARLL